MSLNLFWFGEGLTQALVFKCLQYKSSENTVGKGEIARTKQFPLFPQCFLPVWRTFFHFNQIWNCCLQFLSVFKSLKFVVWERVNRFLFIQCRLFKKKILKPLMESRKMQVGSISSVFPQCLLPFYRGSSSFDWHFFFVRNHSKLWLVKNLLCGKGKSWKLVGIVELSVFPETVHGVCEKL